MTDKFKNKVVMVTGSSFGIGMETAIGFALEQAKIILVDHTDDTTTLDHIKNLGADVVFIKCDVSDPLAVRAMVNKAVSEYGRIDCAFNNAGIEGQSAATADCTLENWDKVIKVNLHGVWLCMKYQITAMLKQGGGGAIVNNSSVAGLKGFANSPAYVASKHGVIGLTKTAALEYAQSGIRINAVCPGVIRTPMIDRFTGQNKAIEKQFENLEPMGRLGEPGEVADVVMWLCSDASSFVTGHALAVDGGWTAK